MRKAHRNETNAGALREKRGFPIIIKGFPKLSAITDMPIFAYRCDSCGFEKDVLQKRSDQPLTECPSCGQQSFNKRLTAPAFQLKGSGWYVTDFRDKGKPAAGGEGAASPAPAPAAAPAPVAAPAPAPAPAAADTKTA